MSVEMQVRSRAHDRCELCSASNELSVYTVPPDEGPSADRAILVCQDCLHQLSGQSELTPSRWTFLKDCMWSEVPAVQVVSWRMLHRLKSESWAQDALDQLYLDDELLQWAQATGDHEERDPVAVHQDVNGARLQNGDTIVLTKSLDVKGSQINARIGTTVKNIRLVQDNTEQIEGKIEGQQIVILTKYVRKTTA